MSKSFNMWGVSLAKHDNDGKVSYSLKKTYKDKSTGEYKESKVLFTEDLMRLRILIDSALKEEVIERHFNNGGANLTKSEPEQEDDFDSEDSIPF